MSKSRVHSVLKSRVVPDIKRAMDVAVLEMATTIHARSVVLAPRAKGNLVSSGRIKRNDTANYSVIFGGNADGFSVPYAKRRHYENKKNPQTLRYLEKAGDGVKREGVGKYVKGGIR